MEVNSQRKTSMFKKRSKYFWVAGGLAIVIAALLTGEIVRAWSDSRIEYQGKPLKYWFSQTPFTVVGTNGATSMIAFFGMRDGSRYGCYLEKQDDVRKSFVAMGSNCLPFLVKKLGGRETPVSRAIRYSEYRLRINLRPVDKNIERGQALTALTWLSPLPRETYEQIRALNKSSDPHVAAAAKEALSGCDEMKPRH